MSSFSFELSVTIARFRIQISRSLVTEDSDKTNTRSEIIEITGIFPACMLGLYNLFMVLKIAFSYSLTWCDWNLVRSSDLSFALIQIRLFLKGPYVFTTIHFNCRFISTGLMFCNLFPSLFLNALIHGHFTHYRSCYPTSFKLMLFHGR